MARILSQLVFIASRLRNTHPHFSVKRSFRRRLKQFSFISQILTCGYRYRRRSKRIEVPATLQLISSCVPYKERSGEPEYTFRYMYCACNGLQRWRCAVRFANDASSYSWICDVFETEATNIVCGSIIPWSHTLQMVWFFPIILRQKDSELLLH